MKDEWKLESVPLKALSELVDHVANQKSGKLYLYRGQNVDAPLLPKVAREYRTYDSTEAEKRVLSELRLHGHMLLDKQLDDWALLCIAQHHGAATRLLDWSTNPLVGLWMALADRPAPSVKSVFVYVFEVETDWILSNEDSPNPFEITRTRVLRPPLNNTRVAAQSGWFTAHRFSKPAQQRHAFIPLEKQSDYSEKLMRFVVPTAHRHAILKQLDKLGVNAQTMFPGLEGLCKHMSWRYDCELDDDVW